MDACVARSDMKPVPNPIMTRLCWCRVCQFIAAGNAAVSVCFPSSGMTISGETPRFCQHRRQRQPHAPAFLPDLRDASVQRSQIAAALDLRAGRLAGRPRDCPARRGDLDGAVRRHGPVWTQASRTGKASLRQSPDCRRRCADLAADRPELKPARCRYADRAGADEKKPATLGRTAGLKVLKNELQEAERGHRKSATPNSNPLPIRP